MLRSAKSMLGYRLAASDGTLGHVRDFYFDEQSGNIRHLLLDLGWYRPGHKVLIEPMLLGLPDWVHRTIPSVMTREAIRYSPKASEDKPVFQQAREHMRNFYEWAPHWTPFSGEPEPQPEPVLTGDVRLRSVQHLSGYTVDTNSGPVGHLSDFVVDCKRWRIAMAVLGPDERVRGNPCGFPLDQIERIDLENRRMRVRFERWTLTDAPEHRLLEMDDPHYEQRVNEYFAHCTEPLFMTSHQHQ